MLGAIEMTENNKKNDICCFIITRFNPKVQSSSFIF